MLGKTFEKIIFNKLFNFLLGRRLLNPNQSVFCPADSCGNQLLSKTHEIFEVFHYNSISLFRDINKVLHQHLLYKLMSVGIFGKRYDLLRDYLSGRFQRVV